MVIGGILASGCAREQKGTNKLGPAGPTVPGTTPKTDSRLIVTPGGQLTGRVASVNPISRFVIATFPLGTMPGLEQRLSVYRDGLKVGEIKITGPQRDINIAGDIVAGDCRIGDEVKAE